MTDIKDPLAPPTADPSSPLPLGEEYRDFRIPQGVKLKNAPEDYWHGSVKGEVEYWKARAAGAEERLRLRLAELEIEKRATSKLVVIESPFAGDRETNARYLHAIMRDSFKRGEFPWASHAIYPQFLDDDKPEERRLGIEAGLAWGARASKTILCTDLNISRGMQMGIDAAKAAGREIVERSLVGWKK